MEMNKVVDEYKEKYNLNYSVLATPAEGLSGRFTKIDRRKYGKIDGVTDRDYYVNSFHVDVKEPISITEKIRREAPSTPSPAVDTSRMWNWTGKL